MLSATSSFTSSPVSEEIEEKDKWQIDFHKTENYGPYYSF